MSETPNQHGDAEVPPWDQPPGDPAPRARPPKSGWWSLVKLFAIFAVCLTIGTQLIWTVGSHVFPPELSAERRDPTASSDVLPSEPATPPPPARRVVIDTDYAVQRSKLLRTQADIQAAEALLRQVREQQSEWDEVVLPLLTSKEGRRLATDPAGVSQLVNAIDRERLERAEVDRLRESLVTLAVPVEAALEDEATEFLLSAEFSAELARILDRLRTGLALWRQDNALVRVLVREAGERVEADQSLGDAIEAMRADDTRRRAEEIDRQVSAAKQRLDQEKAASRTRLEELNTQKQLETQRLEALRREAEVAGLKQQQALMEEKIAAQRKRAELEHRFEVDLPEVRRVLAAFITPGHQQLVDGKLRRVETQKPLSLSALRAIGALGEDEASETKLYYVAGTDRNDRPRGPFNYHNGRRLRDHETAVVQRARRLLLDYGDLLVEKGMLEP